MTRAPCSPLRQQELETGPALARREDEVAAMGSGVSTCDRQAESAAARVLAPRETVEELRLQLLRNPRAAVLDGDPEVAVAALGGDDDRRAAVAGRVDEQVRDDAVEDERVDDAGQARRDVELHVPRLRHGGRHDLSQDHLQDHRLAVDRDSPRVELGEVEQLLDQPPQPLSLLIADLYE